MKTEQWQADLAADYARRGRRKKVFTSESNIELKDVYDQEELDAVGFDPQRDLGLPGEYPYTRGIYPAMYRADFWVMGQYSGFGNPEDTNKRFKYLMSKGQTALALALDLPTQLGVESGEELADGEVGKAGVAINSLKDMEAIFAGIPLNETRQIFTTANAIGPIMLALFLALGEKQGLDPSQFTIVLQNDILKEYVARGAYIFPPTPSLKFAIDAVEYCTKHHPHFKSLVVCGSHMRQGGATATQELAFSLSNAQAYFDEAGPWTGSAPWTPDASTIALNVQFTQTSSGSSRVHRTGERSSTGQERNVSTYAEGGGPNQSQPALGTGGAGGGSSGSAGGVGVGSSSGGAFAAPGGSAPARFSSSSSAGGASGASPSHASFVRTLAALYRAGGARSLYAGITPTLLRAAPSNAVIFLVYEEAIKAVDGAMVGAAPRAE